MMESQLTMIRDLKSKGLQPSLCYRGAVQAEKLIPQILEGDYSFIQEQKMAYYLSCSQQNFGFHIVDYFASLPLFYTIHKGVPIVSEVVDDLLPYLSEMEFNPAGYYYTGGLEKGGRSVHTPFKGIQRIPPGHYLEYRNGKTKLHCYWSFDSLKESPFQGTYAEACETLGFLIRQAVKRCYEFAPNAALHVSGGLDSGSIAAIICQLSSVDRRVYALLWEGTPLTENAYESGFISKYQSYYPQLKVHRLYPYSLKKEDWHVPILKEAGNWHYAHQESEELKICQHMQTENRQYILTGLGGDELASFGNMHQRMRWSVHNDDQAKLYLKWKDSKKKWKSIVKTLIKAPQKLPETLYTMNVMEAYGNDANWYTTAFYDEVRDKTNIARISSWILPVSYEYRLKVLNRNYFTSRSDRWNFIGRPFNVTYLHPLLDTDLVNFCASLPIAFFEHRETRELIKTALKPQVPAPLLQGKKRPMYIDHALKIEEVSRLLKETKANLATYKTTFAASVYDYAKMEQQLTRFEKQLSRSSESQQQLLFAIRLWGSTIARMQQKATYLNSYF